MLHLNHHIKKFLCSYLRGRQTFVEFRNCKAKYRKVKQGVLQGGVLSPVLFNLYIASMPAPPDNIKLVTFADDWKIINSCIHIGLIVKEIKSYLSILDEWFKGQNLFISPSKFSATLFTIATYEESWDLGVKIGVEPVPTSCHKMTNSDQLHQETKVMKVKEHCQMISKQFWLATQKSNHPDKIDLSEPPPQRQMNLEEKFTRFSHQIWQTNFTNRSWK